MENESEHKKFDLDKLQKNYVDASVANVLEANKAIRAAQNWLLIIGLAEMSFLGALLLQSSGHLLYVKVLLVILLFIFIFGVAIES